MLYGIGSEMRIRVGKSSVDSGPFIISLMLIPGEGPDGESCIPARGSCGLAGPPRGAAGPSCSCEVI